MRAPILARRRRPSERTMFAAGRRMHTRCAWCRTRVSRGRAAWSRDEYGAPLCEGCEPEPLACRACRGAGTTGRHTYYDYRSPLGFSSLRPVAHEVAVPCDRCGGDGLEPCAGCGDRAACAAVEE